MNIVRSHVKKVLIVFSIIFITVSDINAFDIDEDRSERINLALRQAGHNLLILSHDSTTSINPILRESNRFSLRIPKLNYDQLPYVIHEAFTDFDISADYRVIVKTCDSTIVRLGYTSKAFKAKNVACQGREADIGCHDVFVHFDFPIISQNESNSKLWSFPLILFLGLGLIISWRYQKKFSADQNDPFIPLGAYSYDHQNQKLINGASSQSLTYRENKLLHLLAQNVNNVVQRETILAEVWEDEGVIVGRSVDVFISRLRKFFKEDQSVGIKSIHGVGYRLEIAK